MAMWTGGLGISNSGSEADQCVTAESFNLSLITPCSACIPAPCPKTCCSPAGKEGLGCVEWGSHAHNFKSMNVFMLSGRMGGWHLSTLLWICSPRSEVMCNEACDAKYLAMNNYNPMMKCWQTGFNIRVWRHAMHFWMYIIVLMQDYELSPLISGLNWIRMHYPYDAAVSNTRGEQGKARGKPVSTSVEQRGRFHCVHLDWHQLQSLVSDLLDSHGN